MFDIRDVLQALQVEPSPDVTWPVGWAVRDKWLAETETLPAKDLRRKTNGPGFHCIAIYPDRFWDEAQAVAAKVVEALGAEKARQPDMFAK